MKQWLINHPRLLWHLRNKAYFKIKWLRNYCNAIFVSQANKGLYLYRFIGNKRKTGIITHEEIT